jgi:DNA-binding response OmpR family regulator
MEFGFVVLLGADDQRQGIGLASGADHYLSSPFHLEGVR